MGTMSKEKILKILEDAKGKNSDVPMRLVRQAFEKLPEPCEDAVSRQDVLDGAVTNYSVSGANIVYRNAVPVEYIESLPSVTLKEEPCEDAVSRADVEAEIANILKGVFVEYQDIAKKAVAKLPSVTPKSDQCEDAVSRKSILDKISKKDNWEKHDRYNIGLSDARRIVQDEPPVAPKRKTGKWIYKDDLKQFFCSECGVPSLTYDDVYIYGMDLPNYCEDCGAKLEGSE